MCEKPLALHVYVIYVPVIYTHKHRQMVRTYNLLLLPLRKSWVGVDIPPGNGGCQG